MGSDIWNLENYVCCIFYRLKSYSLFIFLFTKDSSNFYGSHLIVFHFISYSRYSLNLHFRNAQLLHFHREPIVSEENKLYTPIHSGTELRH